MKTRIVALIFTVLWLFVTPGIISGQHDSNPPGSEVSTEAGEKFNAREFILDHIADSHEWHIITLGEGEHAKHISIYLPVILYSRESGLHFFSSRRFAHGNEYKGFKLMEEGDLKGRDSFS